MKILLNANRRHAYVDALQLVTTNDFLKLRNSDSKAYSRALWDLASDPYLSTVFRLFEAPDIPTEILEFVYDKYKDSTVSSQLAKYFAKCLDTPEHIINEYAKSSSKYIRHLIASRNDLPAETLYRLSEDPEPVVRLAIANNPSVSLEILQKLSQDSNPTVCQAALIERRYKFDMQNFLYED